MSVLLTGASGFIGRRLSAALETTGYDVTRVARKPLVGYKGSTVQIDTLDGDVDWTAAVSGKKVVIHLAALAHVGSKATKSSLTFADLHKVNVEGTVNLARQAAAAGVKRFIFISSIGVNGFTNSRPFTEQDVECPCDSYARSKLEAEEGLWALAHEASIEIVIIRPPLVYGPDAPGNFGALVRWVQKGIPLPLGAIHNKRSLVALDNLVDLIITCIDHPAAANQVFLAGDGEDLSTTELLHGVGKAMGKPVRLIPVPAGLLMVGATMLGKKAVAQRLLGSLQVDISKAQSLLGWKPPLNVEEGLKRCFPVD